MTDVQWRWHRAFLLRSRGIQYKAIAANLGVSKGRAEQLVVCGANQLVFGRSRGRWKETRTSGKADVIRRALWLVRMQAFNRQIARRSYQRTQ